MRALIVFFSFVTIFYSSIFLELYLLILRQNIIMFLNHEANMKKAFPYKKKKIA